MKAIRTIRRALLSLCAGFAAPVLLANPVTAAEPVAKIWEFIGLDIAPDWRREADAIARPEAVVVKNGKVGITARAKTWDRVKITTTNRRFGAGTYTWRVHVPKMGEGDMASIGAFLYLDDKHEVDFEIGPGTAVVRRNLKATESELVCYCTNQAFPYSTTTVKVKAGTWHTLSLSLDPQKDKNLMVRWFIDGQKVKELPTQMPATTRFGIHCSVENLKFLGEHQPLRDHQAVFESVAYSPDAKL